MPKWQPDPAEATSMMQFVLGQGQGAPSNPLAPTFSQQQYQSFGQPQQMSEDQLDYNNSMALYLQKMQGLQFSPETAMLAGGTAIPHEMFEPQVTYEQVPRPGTDYLMRQIRQEPMVDEMGQPIMDPNTGQPVMGPSPVQSWSGMVADEILNGSGNSASAMAKIRQLMQQGEEMEASDPSILDPASETYDPQYAALKHSMPTMYNDFGDPQIDWMTAQQDAQNWEQAYYEDPRPGPAGAVYDQEGNVISSGEGTMELQYDDAGNQILVKRTEEPTEVMEMFQKYGLPSPYEQYEQADFMGADWEAGMQAYRTGAENLRNSKVGMKLLGGITEGYEQAANQAQTDYQAAVQRWYDSTAGGAMKTELEAQARAGLRGETLPDVQGTRVTTTMAGGGGIGPSFRVPTTVKGETYEPSYAKPGMSLPAYLRMMEEAGGGGFTAENVPEDVTKAGAKYAATKKKAQGLRKSYGQREEQYNELESNLEGAREELFTYDAGRALAMQRWTAQNQQTPYTDSLMARRMVPLAAGINTATWVPQG